MYNLHCILENRDVRIVRIDYRSIMQLFLQPFYSCCLLAVHSVGAKSCQFLRFLNQLSVIVILVFLTLALFTDCSLGLHYV